LHLDILSDSHIDKAELAHHTFTHQQGHKLELAHDTFTHRQGHKAEELTLLASTHSSLEQRERDAKSREEQRGLEEKQWVTRSSRGCGLAAPRRSSVVEL
jgi:hypothetical protein